MKKEYDVYLAGPFFTPEQKQVMKQVKEFCTVSGLTVADPAELSPVIVDLPPEKRKAELFKGIFANNIEAMQRSFVLLACIDDRDTGTSFELGWFANEIGWRQMKIDYNAEFIDGAIITFSAQGYGCNVMLSEAADGHFPNLMELDRSMPLLAERIKARDATKLRAGLKLKAGATS